MAAGVPHLFAPCMKVSGDVAAVDKCRLAAKESFAAVAAAGRHLQCLAAALPAPAGPAIEEIGGAEWW